jgi:hypothetical protein
MDSFEQLVRDKAQEGDIDWLVSKLLEKHRINVELVNENVRFANRINLQAATIARLEAR